MKSEKKIRTGALILSVFLSVATFTACEKQPEEQAQEIPKNVLTTCVLNDFSDMTDLYQVILKNSFGSANLNTQAEYVKTGGASAKLTVVDSTSADLPTLKQRLSSELLGYDYTDFTKAKRLKLSMYNPAAEEVTCHLNLEFTKGKTARTTYSLKNGWNDLTYEVDRSALSASFPLDETMYLVCSFERKSQPYTVYLDSILLTQTHADIEAIEYTLDENEICSFDKNYQGAVMSFATDFAAKISLIADYGLTADPERTVSGSAFYVKIAKGDLSGGYRNFTYMNFQQEYRNLIEWSGITAEDTIEWDVYCDGAAYSLTARFYTKTGWLSKYESPVYDENGDPVMVESVDENGNPVTVQKTEVKDIYQGGALKANAWTHFKINVSELEAAAKYLGWLDPEDESCDEIGDVIDRMWFAWGEFTDVDERTLYFDEIKIVKGGANR